MRVNTKIMTKVREVKIMTNVRAVRVMTNVRAVRMMTNVTRLFPDASLVRASARESRSSTQVAPLEISDS